MHAAFGRVRRKTSPVPITGKGKGATDKGKLNSRTSIPLLVILLRIL